MKSRGSQGQISTRCSSPARRTVRSLPSCCHESQCPTAVRSLIHGLGDSQKSWVRHGDDIVPYGHRIHRCVIYRGFLKQGYPPIINFFRGFSINHPAIGVSPFMDTPIYMKNIVGICWHIFCRIHLFDILGTLRQKHQQMLVSKLEPIPCRQISNKMC